MSAKLTTSVFIERSKKKHGEDYDYSLVDYLSNSTKVSIICKKHKNVFEQSPNKHMSGQGCPICRYEKAAKSLLLSTEDFIVSAKKIHTDGQYSYDKTDYKGTHKLVTIYCNIHKEYFEQKPTNHLSGKGCPSCAKEVVDGHILSLVLTTDEFVKRAKDIHGSLYNYEDTIYTRSAGMVSIWCNQHEGYFTQTANSHLCGVGCASCARTGYSTNKAGTLYTLTCGDITKVGITNITAETRAKSVSKAFGAEFSVVDTWKFDDGLIADNVETIVIRNLRTRYERPQARFEGSSECFLNVDYSDLLLLINKELCKAQAA